MKTVLITGCSSGYGLETARHFFAQGWNVIATMRTPREDLLPKSDRLRILALDVTQPLSIEVAIRAAGPIDVLVNNAANDDRHQIGDVTPAYWDDRIAVNLRHLFFCTQAVVPGMKSQGGGAVINLGSVSWHLALPDLAIYQTAKAGIEGMTRGLARDLGIHNIRVTCVVPGGVRTPRQMKLWHTPEEENRMLGQQCIKARVEPHDVAAMVLFLASDDARLCTAHEYFVDAGWR